jgi:hypothetical protein
MAGASGLVYVLLGIGIGIVVLIGSIGLVIYGLVANNARVGVKASVVALVLSVFSALLSSPVWIVVLSGRDSHGAPLHDGDSAPLVGLVIFEAFVIAASAWGIIKQRRRFKLKVASRGV